MIIALVIGFLVAVIVTFLIMPGIIRAMRKLLTNGTVQVSSLSKGKFARSFDMMTKAGMVGPDMRKLFS